MSTKKLPTNEDLDAMFAGIDDSDSPTTNINTASTTTTTATATSSGTSTKKPTPTSTEADDDDPLAELANLAAAPRVSSSLSRPQTPRSLPGGRVKGDVVHTPTSTVASGRTSEDREQSLGPGVGSGQKGYSVQGVAQSAVSQMEQQTQPEVQEAEQGGGWGGWGGWATSLASAAVKQAQGAVKEIQKNEEAQKWAEQVKGYGALNIRGLANLSELRDKALPTFTNILHTLAPPISQHERLQIHITHDLNGYPSMDPLIHQTFSRVMSQVEGGDLLVIQRGSESTQRRMSEIAYVGGIGSSGWSAGPWWRANDGQRTLNAVAGLSEGTKLTRVSARSYGNDFYAARGGLEEAAKQATVVLSEHNPVRTSDIFLAIQAISHTTPAEVSRPAGGDADAKETGEKEQDDEFISFAIYLHDPIHSIDFSTVSQSFPQRWSDWLNATSEGQAGLPDEIADIIEGGGVDPREWVAEWLEEILTTAVGVVAQRYVARRMGVGEGGLGRGKPREEAVDSNGGEAARAGII